MNRKILATVLIAFGVIVLAFSIASLVIFSSKVSNPETVRLYIQPNTPKEKVEKELREKGVLNRSFPYSLFVRLLSDNKTLRAGYYEIEPKTKQLDLAKKLVRGLQTPVKITINKVRTKEDFAQKLADKLLASQRDILLAIDGSEMGDNLFDYVICNTYEVYWTITADKLLERLKNESDKWWADKTEKLTLCGLSRHEAVVLASIVEEETNKSDEKPTIAGVYLNRLGKGMLLQADPTVKYAVGDFSIKRIMYKHLQTDSPYNTYIYKGLPPTAICLPTQSSILAVLNYEQHDYIFFCAKDDFSGYHAFATTPDEHYANANRYQAALNRLGIK